MTQPEAKFKQRLAKCFAEVFPERSWWSYVEPVRAGTPDLVFSVESLGTLWVEAKANDGDLSAIQEKQIARMRAAGMHVAVLTALTQHVGEPLPWRRWSIATDFLDPRRGNRIHQGELLLTHGFWEGLLS